MRNNFKTFPGRSGLFDAIVIGAAAIARCMSYLLDRTMPGRLFEIVVMGLS